MSKVRKDAMSELRAATVSLERSLWPYLGGTSEPAGETKGPAVGEPGAGRPPAARAMGKSPAWPFTARDVRL